ncbi:MAG: ABC transporter substrate-binding protein [Deltaproteobacteria bacterium]|nr:ABC transporter substrate-binding protein [Deltaproteobacteria bacterium]
MRASFRKFFLAATAAAAALSISAESPAAVKAPPKGGDQALQSNGQVNAPQGTPTREIQDIEMKMDAYKTGAELSAEDKANNAKIKRDIITGTFDLRELCRLALDKHWGGLSAAEQNNFVALMTDLLETKALFSKEQTKTRGKAYTVQYLGDTYLQEKTRARTRTKVVVPKENVKVDIEYKMKKDPGGWKIFDVVVDDASLVENYRYQFDAIISKNGYGELVRRMQNKLKELKTKAS